MKYHLAIKNKQAIEPQKEMNEIKSIFTVEISHYEKGYVTQKMKAKDKFQLYGILKKAESLKQ